MDPGERYEYENDNADSYSEEDWYYQPGNPGGRDLDEDDEWDDEYYDDQEDLEE